MDGRPNWRSDKKEDDLRVHRCSAVESYRELSEALGSR